MAHQRNIATGMLQNPGCRVAPVAGKAILRIQQALRMGSGPYPKKPYHSHTPRRTARSGLDRQ